MVKQSRAELFRLTPIWVPEEPPAKRAKKTPVGAASTQDASMVNDEAKGEKESSDEVDSDSSGSNSDFSSEDGSSEASGLDKFEEAYKELADLLQGWMKSPSTELSLAIPMMMCRGCYWKEVWTLSKR